MIHASFPRIVPRSKAASDELGPRSAVFNLRTQRAFHKCGQGLTLSQHAFSSGAQGGINPQRGYGSGFHSSAPSHCNCDTFYSIAGSGQHVD
jgi:hypothetical protein